MVRTMATWSAMAAAAPDIASTGRALFYQHGVGLAYLGTVTAQGAPRLHPVCPLLDGTGVFAFIIPSPKQRDLQRDGRYALHSFPCPGNEDAFALTGRATAIDRPDLRAALGDQFVRERTHLPAPPPAADHVLFEFHIDRCLLTTTTGHGDTAPKHRVWRAESGCPPL